ncbi:MAG: radical SAM protein [Candidatus Zixiibacteriota bacterium]|nr:MAG: radical SAM protein [candidate division Zixibacteria bacterium]
MANSDNYRYVKGVGKSDRLGDVLSVDFSPVKVCSFDCIYCGLGRTTDKTLQRRAFYPVEEVFDEIRDWVSHNSPPDYVLLTGSGEPTLYTELGRLVRLVKSGFPGVKSYIYSNGSLLYYEDVRKDISAFDLIMINLNTDDEDTFQRICRPHHDTGLDRVIDGIKQLRKEYTGPLWMDVILVKGVNTQVSALENLMDTIADIAPERCIFRLPRSAAGKESQWVRVEIPESLKRKWRNLPFEVVYDS